MYLIILGSLNIKISIMFKPGLNLSVICVLNRGLVLYQTCDYFTMFMYQTWEQFLGPNLRLVYRPNIGLVLGQSCVYFLHQTGYHYLYKTAVTF